MNAHALTASCHIISIRSPGVTARTSSSFLSSESGMSRVGQSDRSGCCALSVEDVSSAGVLSKSSAELVAMGPLYRLIRSTGTAFGTTGQGTSTPAASSTVVTRSGTHEPGNERTCRDTLGGEAVDEVEINWRPELEEFREQRERLLLAFA